MREKFRYVVIKARAAEQREEIPPWRNGTPGGWHDGCGLEQRNDGSNAPRLEVYYEFVECVGNIQVPWSLMGISSENYSTPNPFSMGLHLFELK